ncbi:MAG: DNA-binding protein [Candidatus Curtissbacteria bacterium GW2011_GWC2_38_9]|uniref:Transcriptional regulator n=3 Tax=Candidatus Curtissiibacteriota TaxID=1752717 RepID=A0A1F5HT05_9BACT|nr:MAG: DNA-binding protein [Candidatus Curtissbacteria bacterium GW2011_GWC2_38_9]KKS03257.1 MAG: DNA-binding protein [Candidatus Curtissbacteria bacterium GW2011_GWA2_41_24]OGE07223.1 MAG: transcriptional regulator [Candidatus Curtissbacteria bacterium RIFCSPLOWO2_02_41_11]
MTGSAVSKRIGKRIRQIRGGKSISQEDLAGDAGLNRAYVGYIERGERNPSTETLARIAKALKVPLQKLFE